MSSLLSHPATVHVPLALAVLLPVAFVLIWWATEKSLIHENFGWVFVGLAIVVLTSSFLAYFTGEKSKVMSAASSELLLSHEWRAQGFGLLWIAVTVIAALAQWTGKSRKLWLRLAILALLAAQAIIGIQLGRLGGEIVFGAVRQKGLPVRAAPTRTQGLRTTT